MFFLSVSKVLLFYQVPIFLSVFSGLRGMASLPVESLMTGGMGWFADLTVCDPYYILPFFSMASIFLMFEVFFFLIMCCQFRVYLPLLNMLSIFFQIFISIKKKQSQMCNGPFFIKLILTTSPEKSVFLILRLFFSRLICFFSIHQLDLFSSSSFRHSKMHCKLGFQYFIDKIQL